MYLPQQFDVKRVITRGFNRQMDLHDVQIHQKHNSCLKIEKHIEQLHIYYMYGYVLYRPCMDTHHMCYPYHIIQYIYIIHLPPHRGYPAGRLVEHLGGAAAVRGKSGALRGVRGVLQRATGSRLWTVSSMGLMGFLVI